MAKLYIVYMRRDTQINRLQDNYTKRLYVSTLDKALRMLEEWKTAEKADIAEHGETLVRTLKYPFLQGKDAYKHVEMNSKPKGSKYPVWRRFTIYEAELL